MEVVHLAEVLHRKHHSVVRGHVINMVCPNVHKTIDDNRIRGLGFHSMGKSGIHNACMPLLFLYVSLFSLLVVLPGRLQWEVVLFSEEFYSV